MKKNLILDSILMAVFTLLLGLGITALTGYLARDKGSVLVGPSLVIEKERYVPINISVFTDRAINDLIVSIPTSTVITDIVSSSPIQMQEVPDIAGTHTVKRLIISGIEPNQTTSLLIPVASEQAAELVQSLNAKELRFQIQSWSDLRDPTILIRTSAAISLGLYSLFWGLFYYWFSSRLNKMDLNMSEGKKEFESTMEKSKREFESGAEALSQALEKSEAKLSEALNVATRMRLLLVKRIADYSKELTFWQDTIRKVLYESTRNKDTADKLINAVTANLNTYSTRHDSIQDFDLIAQMADFMSSSERNAPAKHDE